MSRTRRAERKPRDNYRVPKTVQDLIPIKRIWKDGIFLVGVNAYSKSYRFSDVNYYVASDPDKAVFFKDYCTLLNSFDSNAEVKITVSNHALNQSEFERNTLMQMKDDELDKFRYEYNEMLLEKASGDNRNERELYITVTVWKKSIEEARVYFRRTDMELRAKFSELGSKCEPLNAVERLRILHGVYRSGEEDIFFFDEKQSMRLGHDFRDYICPDSIEKHSNYLKVGEKYARVLFLKDFANKIDDEFISELTDIDRNMMLSVDILPVSPEAAIRDIQNRLLSIETNIANWQRRQNNNYNFSAVIPYDMALQRKQATDFLDDLVSRDQRMMYVTVTLMHMADTKEELDSDTERLLSIARQKLCQMAVMNYQQIDAFNTVLPIGIRRVNAYRTLNTESLAILIPFKALELQEKGGIYFGQNAISNHMIFCNLSNLMNQSMFILGIPGSGKSVFAKLLIIFLALATDADIVAGDPEGEYGLLFRALGGTVISIDPGGKDRINVMDMEDGYGDRNPIADKSEFIMSVMERMEDGKGVTAAQKSLIDRCVGLCYQEARLSDKVPTLCMLREKLAEQPEPEAKELALNLELYTTGTLDIFAHETNVDMSNRLICFDIHELRENMRDVGQLAITDAIRNRVAVNAEKGRKTYIFMDEFHKFFEHEYSANFFGSAWRQFRKRNASPCAITQNVSFVLGNPQVNSMLANSEMIVMLKQSPQDEAALRDLFNISKTQCNFSIDVEPGSGLLKYGNVLVPFNNQFPKDTEIYQLITTNPQDKKRT